MPDSDRTFEPSTASPVVRSNDVTNEPLPDADAVLKRRAGDSSDWPLARPGGPAAHSKPTPVPPNRRIEPFPFSVDLGEHIVGSTHALPMVLPKLVDQTPSTTHTKAIVSIQPARPFVSRPPATDPLKDYDHDAADKRRAEAFAPVGSVRGVLAMIPIQFSPKTAGNHEADVSILLRLPDEVMDQRIVRVSATARRLEDAPARAVGESGVSGKYDATEIPQADLESVRELHKDSLRNAHVDAKDAADAYWRGQTRALKTANEHAKAYGYKPPKSSAWEWLAELAITMAVGGIAGVVGRLVADKLASKIAKLATAEKAAAALKQYSQVAIADTVKDGLKNTLKAPLVKVAIKSKANEPEDARAPDSEGSAMERSSDRLINFFAIQGAGIDQLATENQTFVNNQNKRLQHVLLEAPEHAVAVMESIKEGMKKGESKIEERQQTESEQQWVSAVARSSLGSDPVRVNGGQRETTKFDRPDHLGRIENGRGVLLIRTSGTDEGLSVTSAKVTGISQPIADRLLEQDLSAAPIPIRIDADSDWIFRDEVGRVRVLTAHRLDEVQRHREAQRIVDRVLTKSLLSWGVKVVETDDGGRG